MADNFTLSTNYFGISNENKVLLGNGKIGMLTSNQPQNHGISSTYITVNFDHTSTHNNEYSNTIDTFNFHKIVIDNNPNIPYMYDSTKQTFDSTKQTLYMKKGLFELQDISSSYISKSKNTEIRVLRQYPYAVLQSITIYNNDTTTPITNLSVYHYVDYPNHNSSPIDYMNNIVDIKNKPHHIFSASTHLTTNDIHIAKSSCYIFENDDDVRHIGYNMNTSGNSAYHKFVIKHIEPTKSFTFHILTCMLTSKDVNNPKIEVTRMIINICQLSINDIISAHENEWNKQWESSIIIDAKNEINDHSQEEINEISKTLNMCIYNIYSSIRDDINVELNPLNLSAIDFDGNIMWNADLWLIPVLLILKPKSAKTLLDYRYIQLETAKKFAMANGHRGSKYPFMYEAFGYNNLYWNSTGPTFLFNSALISINTWNYYRISKDKNWLQTKGFKILKNNAIYFHDIISPEKGITNVSAFNYDVTNNNTFTNYLILEAIRVAIEATYELNYQMEHNWINTYNILKDIIKASIWSDINNSDTNQKYDLSKSDSFTITTKNTSNNVFFEISHYIGDTLQVIGHEIGEAHPGLYSSQMSHSHNNYRTFIYNTLNELTEQVEPVQELSSSSCKILVDSNTTYTIYLKNSQEYPIHFLDKDDTVISISNDSMHNVSGSTENGYWNSSDDDNCYIQINGSNLSSYIFVDKGDDTNKSMIAYGYNAFTTNASQVNIHLNNIIKMHDESNINDLVDVPEPLIFLTPYYSKHFFTKYIQTAFATDLTKDNLKYYEERITDKSKTDPFNILLKCMIHGTIAQNEGLYVKKQEAIDKFYNDLKMFNNLSVQYPWYTLYPKNSNNVHYADKYKNILSWNAMYIYNFLYTIGGMRIFGSINDTRFYTENFEITNKTGYVMPSTWKSLSIFGIGLDKKNYVITNIMRLNNITNNDPNFETYGFILRTTKKVTSFDYMKLDAIKINLFHSELKNAIKKELDEVHQTDIRFITIRQDMHKGKIIIFGNIIKKQLPNHFETQFLFEYHNSQTQFLDFELVESISNEYNIDNSLLYSNMSEVDKKYGTFWWEKNMHNIEFPLLVNIHHNNALYILLELEDISIPSVFKKSNLINKLEKVIKKWLQPLADNSDGSFMSEDFQVILYAIKETNGNLIVDDVDDDDSKQYDLIDDNWVTNHGNHILTCKSPFHVYNNKHHYDLKITIYNYDHNKNHMVFGSPNHIRVDNRILNLNYLENTFGEDVLAHTFGYAFGLESINTENGYPINIDSYPIDNVRSTMFKLAHYRNNNIQVNEITLLDKWMINKLWNFYVKHKLTDNFELESNV